MLKSKLLLEKELAKSAIYRIIGEAMSEGLYIVDTSRNLLFWNKRAEAISGFSSSEVLGHCCSDDILQHVNDQGVRLCVNGCPLAAAISDGVERESQVYLHHKTGHRVPVKARVVPLQNEKGEIYGAVEVFSELPGKKELLKMVGELEKLALLDILTQVPNRAYGQEKLNGCFAEFLRFQRSFGILYIDIDHFKKLNDTYGHKVGDDALVMVARTLAANLRPFDTLARWGGEEFLVCALNINSRQLVELAERLRSLVEQSYLEIGTERLFVTISVGAAEVRQGDNPVSLLERADHLLYESKSRGRNRVTADALSSP